jgi:hypothetical protein
MDQNQTPSFEIPKSHEAAPLYSGSAEVDPSLAIEGTREILPSPHAQSPQQQAPTVVAPIPSLPLQVAQQTGTQPSQDSHLIADDADVMEKEWVDRAKKIISLTSHDPYLEAVELGKLKSTYIKKRFDKDLPPMTDGAK